MSTFETTITNPKKQLEFYKDLSEQLQRENKKNKEQLEEINKMIEKCGFVNIEQVMLSYCGLIAQQKEVKKRYEENWNKLKWYIMKKDCHNETFTYLELIGKMKELERGVSDE